MAWCHHTKKHYLSQRLTKSWVQHYTVKYNSEWAIYIGPWWPNHQRTHNTLMPYKYRCHFAENFFKCIMKSLVFWLIFHSTLFIKVSLVNIGLDNGLVSTRCQAIIWIKDDLIYQCHIASAGHTESTVWNSQVLLQPVNFLQNIHNTHQIVCLLVQDMDLFWVQSQIYEIVLISLLYCCPVYMQNYIIQSVDSYIMKIYCNQNALVMSSCSLFHGRMTSMTMAFGKCQHYSCVDCYTVLAWR